MIHFRSLHFDGVFGCEPLDHSRMGNLFTVKHIRQRLSKWATSVSACLSLGSSVCVLRYNPLNSRVNNNSKPKMELKLSSQKLCDKKAGHLAIEMAKNLSLFGFAYAMTAAWMTMAITRGLWFHRITMSTSKRSEQFVRCNQSRWWYFIYSIGGFHLRVWFEWILGQRHQCYRIYNLVVHMFVCLRSCNCNGRLRSGTARIEMFFESILECYYRFKFPERFFCWHRTNEFMSEEMETIIRIDVENHSIPLQSMNTLFDGTN